MIYTSYFAKINKLPASIVPISIAAKPPAGYKGAQYKKLAPKYDFFMEWKRTHDNEYYIKCYDEQVLSKLTAEGVLEELKGLVKDTAKDICLVCYEKPTDFCHRHLVAEWLDKNGIACAEYGENNQSVENKNVDTTKKPKNGWHKPTNDTVSLDVERCGSRKCSECPVWEKCTDYFVMSVF